MSSQKKQSELYKPFVSKAKGKKYSVYVIKNGSKRLIHFGDSNMQQFHDKLGHYESLNHNNKERRRRYLARAKGIKDKEGNLTWKNKNSANYYSVKYLW